jgi:hypothetical protein
MRSLLCALALFLLSAGTCIAQEDQAPDPIPAATSVVPGPVILSQGDARWKNLRLGNSTIGKQGCLFMSVTAILMEQGLTHDPRQLVSLFTKTGLVDRMGRLRTQGLAAFFPILTILDREPVASGETQPVQDWLTQGAFVLLRLDHPHAARAATQHWVRATQDPHGTLIVIDPDGGKVDSLANLYGTKAVKEMVVFGTK